MPVIVRRVDKKTPGNGWWSEKERLQAASAFVVIGNYRLTAAAVNIPEETIRRWALADWWKEALDEIRKSSKIELTGKISNVINKTMLQLEDRVENGDFFYDPKTGKFIRKPINASVASKIAGDLITKTLVLEKEVTQERVSDEGLEDRLKKLKDEMLRFAGAKTIEAEVVHVEETAPIVEVESPSPNVEASIEAQPVSLNPDRSF